MPFEENAKTAGVGTVADRDRDIVDMALYCRVIQHAFDAGEPEKLGVWRRTARVHLDGHGGFPRGRIEAGGDECVQILG
jgi:hypothetical protein